MTLLRVPSTEKRIGYGWLEAFKKVAKDQDTLPDD
jgi:hypothetical protein